MADLEITLSVGGSFDSGVLVEALEAAAMSVLGVRSVTATFAARSLHPSGGGSAGRPHLQVVREYVPDHADLHEGMEVEFAAALLHREMYPEVYVPKDGILALDLARLPELGG